MEPRPWGFWGTLGLGLLVAAAFVGASQLAFVLFLVLAPAWGIEVSPETWRTNGLLWTLSVAFSAPAMLGFTWLFARLRRGIRVGEYLALKRAQTRDVALFCTLLLGWLVLSDHLAVLCRQPVVPEVMLEVYRTAYFPPLLWLALIVGAPISEEIFFRGFLFKGILHSRLSGPGAILLTSLLWSVVHLQYDGFGVAIIFVTGLLFGYARLKTDSILPGILMHALMNALATLQVMAMA